MGACCHGFVIASAADEGIGDRGFEVVGGALTVWIATQMAMLASAHWLQRLYLTVGLGTMLGSCWLWVRLYVRESGWVPATE